MEVKGRSGLNSSWMTLGSSPNHSHISDNSSFSHRFDPISCRQAGLGATPEGLLTKVEEEVKVSRKSCTTHF